MQNKHSYLTGYVTNLPKGNAEWYVYEWGWGGGWGSTQSGHIISSRLKSQVTFIQFRELTIIYKQRRTFSLGFLMTTKASLNFAPFKTYSRLLPGPVSPTLL